MDYSLDDLIDLIAQHDEHEGLYRGHLAHWLARHDAEVTARTLRLAAHDAQVLRDAADDWGSAIHNGGAGSWLRARADRIEKEAIQFRAYCKDPLCEWAAPAQADEENAWADLRAHMDSEHWASAGVRQEARRG